MGGESEKDNSWGRGRASKKVCIDVEKNSIVMRRFSHQVLSICGVLNDVKKQNDREEGRGGSERMVVLVDLGRGSQALSLSNCWKQFGRSDVPNAVHPS